ncbi:MULTISPECIES: SxtJ family membrane protein [unclassified Leptolyngbya]|uniref:SxtJ family membrane protein n=1 Tax=unclassified Leptolyngbya TaxID=2650499 RepID=UPI001689751B|nr:MULTISPECIES: SxtJ family membrane protein [unclassified Leptolyngbya]MBD1911788.1 sxtJ [Leptolyngbya sp. FACHB-8]MBD2153322.1 sxtJ [Leptolyngbya sp. FACHB-16]
MIFEPIPYPTRAVLREFGLVFGLMVIGLLGVVIPLLRGSGLVLWPLVLGSVSIFCGLVCPQILRSFYYGWMRFGQAFAWINNAIVLSLVYYAVVTPMGVVMRSLLQYDPLHQRRSVQSTFRKTSTQRSRSSMEKPF